MFIRYISFILWSNVELRIKCVIPLYWGSFRAHWLLSTVYFLKIWSSHLLDNLSNCLMNLKNSGDSTGFEPMTSAMPVQCSNQLSYEVTQLRAGQFVGLMFSRERNVVWKKCYMKCGVWNQLKIWSSHLLDNLSNCLMNLKNSGDSTGFEPMTSAMPVQCSNQLSYEVTQLRAGQFVGLMFSRERNVVWKKCYMKCGVWNQLKIWSSHLLANLSNCLMNLKNSGDSTGLDPMTSAMPVQCSNQLSYEVTQLRAGQFVGLMFSRERNVVWKKCYMKCGVWNQLKIWSSHLLDNLSNCLMNLKNSGDSTGFEPMTSAMPVQCSNQLSYEVTQLRAGQFVGLMFSRERNVVWKKCYMKCGVWNQLKIWSSHLLDNLSNCLMNLKNSGDSTGLEPMTSAMPVQCSNQLSYEVTQLRADHIFSWFQTPHFI